MSFSKYYLFDTEIIVFVYSRTHLKIITNNLKISISLHTYNILSMYMTYIKHDKHKHSHRILDDIWIAYILSIQFRYPTGLLTVTGSFYS